jgi:hypothetical protein
MKKILLVPAVLVGASLLGGCVGMGNMMHKLTGGYKETTAVVMNVSKDDVLDTYDEDGGIYYVRWKAGLADGRTVACRAEVDELANATCQEV